MTLLIHVPGTPVGKAAPFVGRHGAYSSPKSKAYEKLVRMAALAQARKQGAKIPIEGRASVEIQAAFPFPKSMSKKKRESNPPMIVKPDIDNITKAVLDGLKCSKAEIGVLKDDNLVARLSVGKFYTPQAEGSLRITIYEF